MRKLFVVIIAALLAALMLPALAQAAITSDSGRASLTQAATTASVTLTSTERTLVKLINAERTKRGLRAVRVVPCLMRAARGHSADMACHKFFSHNSSNGESFAARLVRYGYTRSGYSAWQAGEDLYYGTGLLSAPVAVVRAWMKSPPHRAVLLCKSLHDIGVGSRVCTSGYLGMPSVTFFTMDMGRRIR